MVFVSGAKQLITRRKQELQPADSSINLESVKGSAEDGQGEFADFPISKQLIPFWPFDILVLAQHVTDCLPPAVSECADDTSPYVLHASIHVVRKRQDSSIRRLRTSDGESVSSGKMKRERGLDRRFSCDWAF